MEWPAGSEAPREADTVPEPRPEESRVRAAAELLARHRLEGLGFDGFPEELRPRDEDDAYRIQGALHDILTGAGRGDVVGWKIGCTSPTMQAYLEIDRPAAGGIFGPTVKHHDACFRHSDFVRPGVECELAVRMGRDLEAVSAPFERAEVESAVESVMAAIEIVDDRYRDWRALDMPTLVTDDFFGAACVLGNERLDWQEIDLARASARLAVNGIEVGRGVGADILGDPLAALVWLADRCARNGCSLRAGSVVLLGSVVQTHWVAPSDEVVVENVPFGTVSARFQ